MRLGVLAPTKAAGAELQIVRRLRLDFDPQEFATVVTEVAVALLISQGPLPVWQPATEVLPELGRGWSRDGQPITESDVQRALHRAARTMQALDLVAADGTVWKARPSARSHLPGITLRAEVWSG